MPARSVYCACNAGVFCRCQATPDRPKAYRQWWAAKTWVEAVRWVPRTVIHPRAVQAALEPELHYSGSG